MGEVLKVYYPVEGVIIMLLSHYRRGCSPEVEIV
jgi:hypothetical protein